MIIPSNSYRLLVLGAIVFSLTQLQSKELPRPQQSESELTDGYRRAHDRRDLEGMLALFCWDKVTPEIRKVTEEHVKDSFDDNILAVRITTEHPKGRVNQFLRNGVRYGFNLTVIKELVVESAVPNAGPEMSYHPIGIKDDHYAIALMVPLPNGSATMQHSDDPPEKAPAPSATMGRVTGPAKTAMTVRLDQPVGLKLAESGGGFSATLSLVRR
jgi:hypothetical protein